VRLVWGKCTEPEYFDIAVILKTAEKTFMMRYDSDRPTSKVRLDLAVVRQAKPVRGSEEQVVHRQPGICLPLRPRHALPCLVARVCSRTHRLGVLKGAHVDVQHGSGKQQLPALSRQCSGSLPSQIKVCVPLLIGSQSVCPCLLRCCLVTQAERW
jgi:hypothetical protein